MPTDISLISIRCLGHGGNLLLSEAILEGWKMCNECRRRHSKSSLQR